MDKIAIFKNEALEVIGLGQTRYDLTKAPTYLTRMETTEQSAQKVLKSTDITINESGLVATHDYFTIA